MGAQKAGYFFGGSMGKMGNMEERLLYFEAAK
jgi:hypothetical protein